MINSIIKNDFITKNCSNKLYFRFLIARPKFLKDQNLYNTIDMKLLGKVNFLSLSGSWIFSEERSVKLK